jgi:fructokinase
MTDRKSKTKSTPIVVGTGLVALDVVFARGMMTPIGRWAGGTCGNVMAILAFLGWDSYPVARLTTGEESKQILSDLKQLTVRNKFIAVEDSGGTPVIIEYIRRNTDGPASHRFSLRCPVCGKRLSGHRPITRLIAGRVVDAVKTPAVFFFDRVSPGALILAQTYAERGAVVVFEPISVGDEKQFHKAITLSHIVKYSHERLKEVGKSRGDKPLLVIETLGADGLRYQVQLPKYKADKWQHVSAYSVETVKDSAGAGDWCTAGLIHKLGAKGAFGFNTTTRQELSEAFAYGQALAAWSCSFESPRMGMYKLTQAELQRQVARIRAAQTPTTFVQDALGKLKMNGAGKDSHLCLECRTG